MRFKGFSRAIPAGKGASWRYWVPVAGTILGILLVLLILRPETIFDQSLPAFAEIEDTAEKKMAFFAFLGPYIEEANKGILRDRRRLSRLESHFSHGRLNRREARWLREMATSHGLKMEPDVPLAPAILDDLRKRVDLIPPSLALAQAALESGWGTSRFAREGNNLFGMWCYTPGCGIVPKRRPAGATYEVKKYRSPRESFEDYMRNLNTNRAYASLWGIRETLRNEGELVSGIRLADGLHRYSQEGAGYISKIQNLIRSNQLQRYDEKSY